MIGSGERKEREVIKTEDKDEFKQGGICPSDRVNVSARLVLLWKSRQQYQ